MIFVFSSITLYLLKCTFEKVDSLRYALAYTFPRIFTQRAGPFRPGRSPT